MYSRAMERETMKRTLTADDQKAVCEIYNVGSVGLPPKPVIPTTMQSDPGGCAVASSHSSHPASRAWWGLSALALIAAGLRPSRRRDDG